MYEEHSDLLELLAQQEMELEEYKQSLIKVCQKRTKSKMEDGLNGFNVDELISSIKHKVEEKYGSYIEFR